MAKHPIKEQKVQQQAVAKPEIKQQPVKAQK